MDSIKHAIDLAKGSGAAVHPSSPRETAAAEGRGGSRVSSVRLKAAHLEQMRIVGHAPNSLPGRYYDILRTQVLQEMDKNGWQFLAVTSPTPDCGKTVTACNLAMSVARLPEREALLVDMDMHKAKVGEYLGISQANSLLSVLEDRSTLADTLVEAQFGPDAITVLPGKASSDGASEWMASQTMANLLQTIKREFRSGIVVFDLPPLLIGSDVMSILPRLDAVLLVTGVGTTTPNEIKECQKHLQKSNLLRVVVNKVNDASENFYKYGYSS